jgi:hypothetical protein
MNLRALSDTEYETLVNGRPTTLQLLVEAGAPRNPDGTWNAFKILAWQLQQLRRSEARNGKS